MLLSFRTTMPTDFLRVRHPRGGYDFLRARGLMDDYVDVVKEEEEEE